MRFAREKCASARVQVGVVFTSLGVRADCKHGTVGPDQDHTQLHCAMVMDLFKGA